MPEYVYALHDFTPENPDEVTFKVGDRIEIVEKDDLYGDGWWQVSFALMDGLRHGCAWVRDMARCPGIPQSIRIGGKLGGCSTRHERWVHS